MGQPLPRLVQHADAQCGGADGQQQKQQERMEEKVSLLDVAAIGSCDSMHDILTGKHLVVDELVHHGCSWIVPVLTKRYYCTLERPSRT